MQNVKPGIAVWLGWISVDVVIDSLDINLHGFMTVHHVDDKKHEAHTPYNTTCMWIASHCVCNHSCKYVASMRVYIYTRMLATYLQEWLQTQCDAIHIHVVLYGVWASCFLSSTWCTVIKPCKLMSRESITTSTDIQPSHTAIPGLTFCMNLSYRHTGALTWGLDSHWHSGLSWHSCERHFVPVKAYWS